MEKKGKTENLAQNLSVEYIPVDSLVAYENNSRTHSTEQIQQLVGSIKEYGFTNPVLIDENNVIIAGHGRTHASRMLGMTKIPAIRLVGLTDEQKKALRISDNQLALNAGWDEEMLKIELNDLNLQGFNLDLTGFTMQELEFYVEDDSEEESNESSQKNEVVFGRENPNGDVQVHGVKGSLPPELSNVQISSDKTPKTNIEAELERERIIVVYKKEEKKAVEEFLGFTIQNNKVVYTLDELVKFKKD